MQSLIVILAAVLLYGLVHSLLAARAAKAAARRWLGDLADMGYRLAYNLFAILSFMPIVALVAVLPDRGIYRVPWPWSLINFSLQGLAGLALLAGLLQTGLWSFLGLQQMIEPKTRMQTSLINRGLYAWVRHPLYTAGLVFIWLVPALSLNLLAMNLGLTLYILVGAVFEERRLLAEFGPAYENYRRQVPMLIPRPPHIPPSAKL